jgi:hypothetical protein
MEASEVIELSAGHSIEFGKSTWDSGSTSIRNRYMTPSGGFSPHSSSEIPIVDIFPLAMATIHRDYLSRDETMQLLQAVVDSLKRQIPS